MAPDTARQTVRRDIVTVAPRGLREHVQGQPATTFSLSCAAAAAADTISITPLVWLMISRQHLMTDFCVL